MKALRFGSVVVIIAAVWSPLAAQAAQDDFWTSWTRRWSADYRAGEAREKQLRKEMSHLPTMPARPSGGTQGFLSALRLIPATPDASEDSIDLIWEEDRHLDTMVLCQVRNAIPKLPTSNMGVPEHFQIWSLDGSGNPDRLLADVLEDGKDPVRETYPYYFSGLDLTTRGIRIQSLSRRFHGGTYGYFWGWSEIFCFSGSRNIAPEARLSTSPANQGRIFIKEAYLVDEQTQLGLPHIPEEHKSHGWLSRVRKGPEENVWLEIDLLQMQTVDSIRLYPSNRLDNPEIQGFGFPVRFKIEAFDSENDPAPETLVDYTERDFDNPGNNPVTFHFRARDARKIRLTATRLWSPRTDAYIHLSFSEIEILRNESNLAFGKPVSSTDHLGDKPLHSGWHIGEALLTDGLVAGGRVVPPVEWLGLLEKRRALAAEQATIIDNLQRIRTSVESGSVRTIITLSTLLALALPTIVLILKMRQRRAILAVRKQLASDLHDEVGSNLGGIRMMANTLKRRPDQFAIISSRIQETVSESTESLRDIIWLLAPVDGERRDLTRRFQVLAEILLGDLTVDFDIPDAAAALKWPLPVRRELIFFYREALHNISRHSDATTVRIGMDISQRELVLRIADDGKGMSRQHLERPGTLSNLKLRAEKLHAKLAIDSTPGSGTALALAMDRSKLGF
jgi:signal transduction histidine kinase